VRGSRKDGEIPGTKGKNIEVEQALSGENQIFERGMRKDGCGDRI